MKRLIRMLISMMFLKNSRSKQSLAIIGFLLFILGTVMLPGKMARADELSAQGQEAFSRGMAAAQQQDYKLALKYFQDAEQSDPDAPQIWFNLGLASSKLPGYELRALAWFQAYLLKVPDAPNADAIRKQIGAIEVAFESKMGKILDQFEPLIVSNQHIYAGFRMAYARSHLGDFEGGLRVLRAVTGEKNWDDASEKYKYAARSGEESRGSDDLTGKERIELLRDFGLNGMQLLHVSSDTQLSDYLQQLKNAKDPEDALLKVIITINELSIIYRAINGTCDPGRHPDRFWVKVCYHTYLLRGHVYKELNDYTKAIEYYNKAIALDPKNQYAYSIRGHAHEELKDYTKTIEDYNKAIELAPNDTGNLMDRGKVYYELKNYSRAIEDFSKATELEGGIGKTGWSASAYYNRGIVYSNLNDNPKAIEDFVRAIELFPQYPDAYYRMGNAHFELKNYARAIEDYSKAIEFDPNNELGVRDLALIKKAFSTKKAEPAKPESSGSSKMKKAKPIGNAYGYKEDYPGAISVGAGSYAINFVLPDLDDKKISLKDYKGKVVILYFFATWCEPCEDEVVTMQALYNGIKGQPLEIVAVNVDSEGPEAVKEYVKKYGLAFTILHDREGKVKETYKTTAVPETFIIDQNGVVAEKVWGPRNWLQLDSVKAIIDLINEGP